jgi:branched-chain amino acid transport system ATP-binding protein
LSWRVRWRSTRNCCCSTNGSRASNPTELQQGIALVRSLRGEGHDSSCWSSMSWTRSARCATAASYECRRQIAEGSPDAVLADAEVIRAYLGDDDA